MKKTLFAACAILVFVSFQSCAGPRTVNGNGVTSEKTIAVGSAYSELIASNGIKVILSPSTEREAVVVADQMVMEYVSVTENGGKITVCYAPAGIQVRSKIATTVTLPLSDNLSGISISSAAEVSAGDVIVSPGLRVNFSSAGRLSAQVDTPELRIEASSAATCDIDVKADLCNISASSAAKCRGKFDVGELSVELTSAASCNASGKCDRLKVGANSSASFRGLELEAAEVFVNASSAGSAHVFVTEELGVSLSSAASVKYKGSPRFTAHEISSGASLKKAD